MVISFSNVTVRNYLLEKGRVFTFRKHRRKQFIKLEKERGKAHTSFAALRDWFNEGRGKTKVKDIYIWEVGKFRPLELGPWVLFSGFSSLEDWIGAIIELNGWDGYGLMDINGGWLYMVDWEIPNSLQTAGVKE